MKTKEKITKWSLLEILWLLIATMSTLALSFYWGDKPLAIISSLAGIISVILIAKKLSINYLFGLINVSTYAYLSYQSGFLVEVLLNVAYYMPMQLIGFYMWTRAKKKKDSDGITVKRLTNEQRITLPVISVATILIVGFISKSFGGNMPIVDAASSVLSVFAMYLMVNQYMEQWYLWIIVNSISIIMWFSSLISGTGDMATLIMWVVYLLNSIFGLISWKREIKDEAEFY